MNRTPRPSYPHAWFPNKLQSSIATTAPSHSLLTTKPSDLPLSFPIKPSIHPSSSSSSPWRRSLKIKPRIRPPFRLHLALRQRLLDLLHRNQFLDSHDLTSDLRRDGVEDCSHAVAEPEGFEDALGSFGHADAGADERYAEEGHCDLKVISIMKHC